MDLDAASVTRATEVPASADEVWRSIRDADGLAGWLGDAVDLEVVPGASGTIAEGGTVRRVVVTDVEVGRSIGFTWWDEAAPDQASTVRIELDEGAEDGTTTVTVTESIAGAGMAHLWEATASDVAGLAMAGAAWEGRLSVLAGLGAGVDVRIG